MAPFSIFSHTSGPSEDPDTQAAEPAVLEYRRSPLGPASQSRVALERAARSRGTLPPVVLRLPNLSLVDASEIRDRSWLAEIFFWIFIVLGAALAFYLISSGVKSPSASAERAPALDSSHVPKARAVSVRATVNNGTSFDNAEPSVQASMDVHTARGGDSFWDGASSAPRPGEAAPLGTIIAIPVQP